MQCIICYANSTIYRHCILRCLFERFHCYDFLLNLLSFNTDIICTELCFLTLY